MVNGLNGSVKIFADGSSEVRRWGGVVGGVSFAPLRRAQGQGTESIFMVAWGILLLGGLVLLTLWGSLPETWVVHWNARGQPDGWAHRTPLGVFGPLLFGAGLVAFMQVLKPLLRTQQSPWLENPEASRRLGELNSQALDMVAVSMAVTSASLAIILPLVPGQLGLVLGIAFLSVGLAIAGIVRRSQQVLNELRAQGVELKGFTGLAYNNPDDPRLWVPKLSGVGATLNFAHRMAWPVLIALISVPLAIVGLVLLAAMRATP